MIKARDRRPASQQVTEMLAEAIQSGSLALGDELPSITDDCWPQLPCEIRR